MIWLNVLAVLGLLSAYMATSVSPAVFWPFAICGLGYPILLLANIFFFIYWIVRKKWFVLLPLFAVLLGWSNLSQLIAFNDGAVPVIAGQDTLKVMSYNVQNFDLYNWTENEEARDNMMRIIEKENPDVISFQEFYYEDTEDFHNVKLLVNQLDYKYYHIEKTLTLKNKHHWGLATFSRYPIKNQKSIPFANSSSNAGLYVDLTINDNIIRVFNVHLQSIKLGAADYKYLKTIGEKAPDWVSSKNIVKKLKGAFVKRAEQSEILKDYMDKSPYPVIISGDFNDTPNSYTYGTISKGLQDAFLEVGSGMGGTFAGPLPSFRIDYLLADSTFQVNDFKVINEEYSDHYPIIGVLGY